MLLVLGAIAIIVLFVVAAIIVAKLSSKTSEYSCFLSDRQIY